MDDLILHHEERLIALDAQLTSSFGYLVILVVMLILYRADRRWNLRARL
jgi:hypothetical protein